MGKLSCKEKIDINIKIQLQAKSFKVFFLLFPNSKGQVRFSIFESWNSKFCAHESPSNN
jgi:hypothetical protein